MSRTTASLWALCLGNFVIGTGLNVSLPVAGQLITAFAAAVAALLVPVALRVA
ncbi:MAG: hypothetical protein ACT4P4_18310 [Betaproteobacteria bacterium]